MFTENVQRFVDVICIHNNNNYCSYITTPFPAESLAHDSGRTLVRDEYGYLKGSPNTNS
jgi:hypothetical protein